MRAQRSVLLGHGSRRTGRGHVAGQVVSLASQFLVGARCLSEADALAELLERQPTLADRVTQQCDAALALGV